MSTPCRPQLTVTPSLDYGTLLADRDSSSQQVSVQNSGDVDVVMQDFTIEGPDQPAFSVDYDGCQGQTLTPGSGCNVAVRFTPTEGRGYSAVANVHAADTAFPVTLTGTGGVRSISVSADPLDFGALAVGDVTTGSVTLTSDGNVPFQTIVALLAGGDVGSFRVDADGCSWIVLAPGTGCTMAVRFEPNRVGPLEATLMVITGDGEPKRITLRGNGTAVTPPPTSPMEPRTPVILARPMGVAFERGARGAVRYTRQGVELATVRCVGVPACRVTVRPRFVLQTRTGPRVVALRKLVWEPRGGDLTVPFPRELRGRPTYLLLTLTTRAAGRSATQSIVLRLLPRR